MKETDSNNQSNKISLLKDHNKKKRKINEIKNDFLIQKEKEINQYKNKKISKNLNIQKLLEKLKKKNIFFLNPGFLLKQ